MARSLQDILAHADELARRFEDYEPDPDDQVSLAELQLRRAALARAKAERQVAEAVRAARASGLPWSAIGNELGTSAQAAQRRYAKAS